jgi:hypothetical protein
MPASMAYRQGTTDAETVKDSLVQQFGSETVQQAEQSVILDLMVLMKVITPSEFIEVMYKKCQRIDQMRRAAAGLEADRG